jgi:hypothetical protein
VTDFHGTVEWVAARDRCDGNVFLTEHLVSGPPSGATQDVDAGLVGGLPDLGTA